MADDYPTRALAVAVAALFVVGLALSLIAGAPRRLPSVALDSGLIFHAIRGLVAAGIGGAVGITVWRLWLGQLPTKLSATGAEWAAPLAAPDRDARESLVQVERASLEAIEQLRAEVVQLSAGLSTRSGSDPGSTEPAPASDEAWRRWHEALGDAERKDAVADAIARLPEREKLVIALMYYENLTHDEIAQVLETTPVRVRAYQLRARKLLGDWLGFQPFPDVKRP